MKKDDIIGQKLFETCKLSEFYLNLIVNSKYEDESPLQLATAYKQKLYEIVERYDRLLDANKQREQLCLSFDTTTTSNKSNKCNSSNSQRLPGVKLPTPVQTPISAASSVGTRTSTPNKTSTTTPSTTSSFASTPTTPSQSSTCSSLSNYNLMNQKFYTRSVRSNLSQQQQLNSSYNRLQNINSNMKKSLQDSRRKINHSSKLEQRLASIYYYDDDDDDDYDYEQNTYDDDNQSEIYDYYQQSKMISHKLKSNDSLSTSSSSSASASAASSSEFINKNKESNPMENISLYIKSTEEYEEDDKEEGDNGEEDEENNENDDDEDENDEDEDLNRSQIIEKSHSNLSKDSGVFADSFHSDYSSCILSGIGCLNNTNTTSTTTSSNDDLNNDKQVVTINRNILSNLNNMFANNINSENDNSNSEIDDENSNENLNSPTSSSASTSSTEQTYEDLNSTVVRNKQMNSPQQQTTHRNNSTRLIWGTVSRLVESSFNNNNNNNLDTKSLKSVTSTIDQFNNNNSNNNNNIYRTYLKNSNNKSSGKYVKKQLNTSGVNQNEPVNHNSINLDYDYLASNGIDTSLMSLMIQSNEQDGNLNRLNKSGPCAQSDHLICSNVSLCSTISSPSSSSSGNASTTSSTETIDDNCSSRINNNTTMNLISASASDIQAATGLASASTLSSMTSSNLLKNTPFFFNNYNSLMNVSMLDNIQATNTNLDNMNSSILMFNE